MYRSCKIECNIYRNFLYLEPKVCMSGLYDNDMYPNILGKYCKIA